MEADMKRWAVGVMVALVPALAVASSEMEVVSSVSQCYADRDVLTARVAELEAQVKALEAGPDMSQGPTQEQEAEQSPS